MNYKTLDKFEKYKNILLNKEENKTKRIQAMFKIMSYNTPESVKLISEILFSDKCELVRHEAAFCLGELNFEESRKSLIKSLKIEQSPVVIHECLVALGIIGKKDDIDLMKKFISNKSPIIKNSAIIGIERIKQNYFFDKKENETREEFKKRLISLIENTKNLNDFIQITFKLMTFEDEESVKNLFKIYNKTNCPIVKHEVAFCLGEMRTELAKKTLFEILDIEKDPVVLHEALFALGTYKKLSEEEIKILNKFKEHKDYIVSESANIALDRIFLLNETYKGTEEYEELNKRY
jgi:deoxyhypusine monooxygenase